VLPKRDEHGHLPAEFDTVTAAPTSHHVPEAARGPAIAGTDPHRGLTDTEVGDASDQDKTSRDTEG
jgi:hypothetical protein